MQALRKFRTLEDRGLDSYNYLLELNKLKKLVMELLRQLNDGVSPSRYQCGIPERMQAEEFMSKRFGWIIVEPFQNRISFYIVQGADEFAVKENMQHYHWEFLETCLKDKLRELGH